MLVLEINKFGLNLFNLYTDLRLMIVLFECIDIYKISKTMENTYGIWDLNPCSLHHELEFQMKTFNKNKAQKAQRVQDQKGGGRKDRDHRPV